MPAYPFDPRRIYWNPSPDKRGSFDGYGPYTQHGPKLNPTTFSTRKTLVGRIIVGFKVGNRNRWKMDDLVKLVERLLTKSGSRKSASFVAQKGLYQSLKNNKTVTEDGAQVFIIDQDGLSPKQFEARMLKMAEDIAREFKQEEVILEIQLNGVSQVTMGVAP